MSTVNGRPRDAGAISGALQHTGSTAGVYGVTPVTRPSAYTQTYDTSDKTHSLQTQQALTDSSGGTASTTLAAIRNSLSGGVGLSSPTADDVNTELTTIRNAVASLAARLAETRVDMADVKSLVTAVIDDLQSEGWLQ